MAASVRHFAGFLKALGGGPFNLVGHSRGGYVVARTTLDYPRLVESCVLIDSNTASPGPGRNETCLRAQSAQARDARVIPLGL